MAADDTKEPNSLLMRRVYFDTSVLWQLRWPDTSGGKLSALAKLAERKGIELCIPEPVRLEHRGKWIRELIEAQRTVDAKTDEALSVFSRVHPEVYDNYLPESFDEEEELRSYDAAFAKGKADLKVRQTPMTDRSLEWFMEAATRRLPPFDAKKDRGVRDAVIFQSVLHDLAVRPLDDGRAVLLALDGDLSEGRLGRQIAEANVPLAVLGSVDELEAALQRQLGGAERSEWQEHTERVMRFIQQTDLSELQELVSTGLPGKSLGNVKVLSVYAVELGQINPYHAGPPPEQTPASVFFSFGIRVNVSASVSHAPYVMESSVVLELALTIEASGELSTSLELSDFQILSVIALAVDWISSGVTGGGSLRDQLPSALEVWERPKGDRRPRRRVHLQMDP